MATLTNEISSLISQLSENKQQELMSFIRNFLDNNQEQQKNEMLEDDNLLKLVEEHPIVVSPQGFRDFIKACLSDDWEISEEDLAFARKERRIKAAQ